MLFLKNDSCIYCTTIKVETPYSGKRKCPPENQTGDSALLCSKEFRQQADLRQGQIVLAANNYMVQQANLYIF